jgi:hypothetical protein
MNSELAELASSAALKFVEQLTTAAWQGVVSAVGALWRRVHPARAETVEADAAETRAAALADPAAVADLAAEWRGRLYRLVVTHPAAAAELRALLAEWSPQAGDSQVRMRATAYGRSRIVQAGRDAHVTAP